MKIERHRQECPCQERRDLAARLVLLCVIQERPASEGGPYKRIHKKSKHDSALPLRRGVTKKRKGAAMLRPYISNTADERQKR